MTHIFYLTKCPECGGTELTVRKIKLVATGETKYIASKLEPDGFVFDSNLKDNSTTDEKVSCDNCNKIYDLSDLMLDVPVLIDKDTGLIFDDYTENEEEYKNEFKYWTQLCEKHAVHGSPQCNDAGGTGFICGVKGCDEEADYNYDFNPKEKS